MSEVGAVNFEDLAHVGDVGGDFGPDVPEDYFRRPAMKSSAPKRQRTEVDDNGMRVVTDDDDGLLGDFHQGDANNEWDEHADYMNNQRGQESLERGIQAAQIIRDSRSRFQNLSKGQKKIYTLTKTKNYTNDDLLNKLEMDDEGLAFVSMVSPDTDILHRVLGPEVDQEECWGCSRGIGVARINKEDLKEMREMMLDLYPTCNILKFVALVYLYFRERIMKPTNEKRRKGEAPIEEWLPRSIYDHVTKHSSEPTFVTKQLLDDWREHYKLVRNTEVYKVAVEVARSGRDIEAQDYRVRKRGHDMLKASTEMILKLMHTNPEKMLFHNPNFNLEKNTPGVIAPKTNVVETTKPKSVWENKDL